MLRTPQSLIISLSASGGFYNDPAFSGPRRRNDRSGFQLAIPYLIPPCETRESSFVAPLRRRWAASLISLPRPHGNNFFMPDVSKLPLNPGEEIVNGLIYLIGLIVVILFILSFLGLR